MARHDQLRHKAHGLETWRHYFHDRLGRAAALNVIDRSYTLREKILGATPTGSLRVLTRFHPDPPLRVASDASSYGLVSVLSHPMPDGTERPIGFASRTLNSAEQNYSQIDEEALGIVWSLKKFHTYQYVDDSCSSQNISR